MIDYKIHNDHRLFPKENTIEAHRAPEKKISTEQSVHPLTNILSLLDSDERKRRRLIKRLDRLNHPRVRDEVHRRGGGKGRGEKRG